MIGDWRPTRCRPCASDPEITDERWRTNHRKASAVHHCDSCAAHRYEAGDTPAAVPADTTHDAAIAALAEEGKGRDAIAAALGLKPGVVRGALERIGAKARPGRRPSGLSVPLTSDERVEVERAAREQDAGEWARDVLLERARR